MAGGSPQRIEHQVAPAEAGKTLAAVARAALGGLPWSRVERLIATRRVTLDDRVVTDPAARVAAGARVVITPDAPATTRGMLEPERVVHIDRDVVVVRKPAGLLTVPFDPDDRDTLIDRTRVAVRRLDKGGEVELGAVQRLDKDTTGLVVFARHFAAKKALSAQFSAHTITREYLAIVLGAARDATHESWLVKDRGDGLRGSFERMAHRPARPPADAQWAKTHVAVVERFAQATLVRCRLETGRTHQIRIHLAEAGTPLVGEPVYIRDYRGPRLGALGAPRPMLHATLLAFDHPRTGERLRFEDPPPDDFAQLRATLSVTSSDR